MADDEQLSIYDEVEIEDMTYDEAMETYFYPCPCGDRFQIALCDLQDGLDIGVCPSCSLMIRVIFEVVSVVMTPCPCTKGWADQCHWCRMICRSRQESPLRLPFPPEELYIRRMAKLVVSHIGYSGCTASKEMGIGTWSCCHRRGHSMVNSKHRPITKPTISSYDNSLATNIRPHSTRPPVTTNPSNPITNRSLTAPPKPSYQQSPTFSKLTSPKPLETSLRTKPCPQHQAPALQPVPSHSTTRLHSPGQQ